MKRHLSIDVQVCAIAAGILALLLGAATDARAQAFGLPAMSEETKACVDCHKQENAPIYQQWGNSKHYRANVGCYECHAAAEGEVATRTTRSKSASRIFVRFSAMSDLPVSTSTATRSPGRSAKMSMAPLPLTGCSRETS